MGLVLLVVGALLIGFAKTAVGGVALVSVAIFAAVLPSKASTGVVLPLLLVGDVFAVRAYHAHADWRALGRLLPAVAVGIGAGVLFMSRVDDQVMRRTIAVVLLALTALHVVMKRRTTPATPPTQPDQPDQPTQPGQPDQPTQPGQPDQTAQVAGATQVDQPDQPAEVGGVEAGTTTDDFGVRTGAARWQAWAFGSLAGFTTMVANAGGPAMSLYLLAARFSVLTFLGTSAWFFFTVNLSKVPFAAGLGLITHASLILDAVLAPAVVLGAWFGRRVVPYLSQSLFERLVLITTVVSALNLLR